MKNWQIIFLIAVMASISMVLTACGSDLNDVPSLAATPTAIEEDETLNNEAIMMAFTECLRGEGLEVIDPVVDSDGNVQKPEITESVSKEELTAAFEVCDEILEGFTFEQKGEDFSEEVDTYVALAECLREEGFEIDDPTTETFETWMTDFKTVFDWDDPTQMKIYETCSGSNSGQKSGK